MNVDLEAFSIVAGVTETTLAESERRLNRSPVHLFPLSHPRRAISRVRRANWRADAPLPPARPLNPVVDISTLSAETQRHHHFACKNVKLSCKLDSREQVLRLC